jgi:hypothetical protein
MTFLLWLIGMVLANVAVPYGAWGFGASYLSISEREFIRRYDLLSIPRLALGGLSCLIVGAGSVVPSESGWLNMAGLVCFVLFGALAVYDTMTATRGAWIRQKADRADRP